MPKYMLIIQGPPGPFESRSPQEQQQLGQQLGSWMETIRASGRYVVSDKLMDEGGKVVSLDNGRPVVTDGPYTEAKEVVGGYVTIRAANYEEAVSIVRDCPFLQLGRIAIRQTDPMGCGDE